VSIIQVKANKAILGKHKTIVKAKVKVKEFKDNKVGSLDKLLPIHLGI